MLIAHPKQIRGSSVLVFDHSVFMVILWRVDKPLDTKHMAQKINIFNYV